MILRALTLALIAWKATAQLTIADLANLSVTGFVDVEKCYEELGAADSDQDDRISRDEYVAVTQGLGPDDFLSETTSFEDLPLVMQSNYYVLACLCESGGNDDCCVGDNAGLEVSGVSDSENLSDTEASYLYLVCSFTQAGIDQVVANQPPTDPPVVDTEIETSVTYEIAVTQGIANSVFQVEYRDDLIGAMDSLAPDVLASLRRKLRAGRRLRSVELTTGIEQMMPFDCPTGIAEGDRCEEVNARINLIFQPTEADPDQVAVDFENEINLAIADGDLQDKLSVLFPNSLAYILDDDDTDRAVGPTDDNDGLSSGAVVGTVIGAMAGVGLVLFLLISQNRDEDKDDEELEPAPREAQLEVARGIPEKGPATLGATTPDYGKNKDAMMDLDDSPPHGGMSADSSSNAGSSGWSSSAGVSSLNTGSHDGLSTGDDQAIAGIGSKLSDMNAKPRGAAAAAATSETVTSRADLDSAIEAGDWAAVGATAALLAATSDSQSYSSQSQSKSGIASATRSTNSSLDAARAAELDNLVDAGDWEGVVLAAAKFESASSAGSTSESRSKGSTEQRTLDSSLASSPSKAEKRQEYRAIVEDLVRRVVPEEIQNVDEMMLQFRGREEELIETLRTMQERAVAQKARQGAQKAAKIEAKQQISAARVAGEAPEESTSKPDKPLRPSSTRSLGSGQVSSQASAKSLGTGSVEGSNKSKSLGSGSVETTEKPSERQKKQSALEKAIESGDWAAVGEAAAMLSDHSVASSADTEEINRLADGISSQGSSQVGSRATDNSERAEELEELIEKGDWTGVVQAASGYDKKDDTKRKSWFDKKQKSDEDEAKKQRRLKRLKEEQDALAQADVWKAIADQSKQEAEGGGDKAASDAADWAIGRSLSALVHAEQQGRLKDKPGSGAGLSSEDDTDEDDEQEL